MIAILLLALSLQSSPAQWTVHCDQPAVQVSPHLYGAFFEEINHAGDGGLYGELLRNREFRDAPTLVSWNVAGDGGTSELEGSDTSRRLKLTVTDGKGVRLENDGYWGIGVKKGEAFLLRSVGSCPPGAAIGASLETQSGERLADAELKPTGGGHFSCALRANSADPNAKLVLDFRMPGTYELELVSLFPENTYKDRPNGMRPDLAQTLAAMKPSFMRFPGGCWVEGDTLNTSYHWKATVGPQADRRSVLNLWGYTSPNGLGFHEYLQFCEDMGAEPLFVVNCGMSHHQFVPVDQLGPWVQDALDAVEYANGPSSSQWGALRAKNGHPKPFNLKFVEIGNENGLFGPQFGGSVTQYKERYAVFYKALHEKYPDLRLIADLRVPGEPVDIVDDHFYNTSSWFLDNADRYDRYRRTGPKVYVGEYAVTTGVGQGDLRGALAESAFMMGLERNSDVVLMASYAPLFADVQGKTWNPDLIYFDSTRVAPAPSYWVQKLFSLNRPDEVVKSELTGVVPVKDPFPSGGIGVGTWGTQAEFRNIKVESNGRTLFESADGKGLTQESGTWEHKDGALRQTGNEDGTRAWAGGPGWTHYTLTLQARKISGSEGFLITVGRKDDGTFVWWNVGGWGNSRSALERSQEGGRAEMGKAVQGGIETGKWYDVKVDYSPERVACYLDGKLLSDEGVTPLYPIYCIAGKRRDGTVVLKITNVSKVAQNVQIDLQGVGTQSVSGEGDVMTSASPKDENTLDDPAKVVPKSFKVPRSGTKLTWTCPGNSLTVLRLK